MPAPDSFIRGNKGTATPVDMSKLSDTPCSWDYTAVLRGPLNDRNERFGGCHFEEGDYAEAAHKPRY